MDGTEQEYSVAAIMESEGARLDQDWLTETLARLRAALAAGEISESEYRSTKQQAGYLYLMRLKRNLDAIKREMQAQEQARFEQACGKQMDEMNF